MGRTFLLSLVCMLATSGCWLSHTIGDDGGPCGFGSCDDAGARDLGIRDAGRRVDLGPPDLGTDSGPPRDCVPGETQMQPCGRCGIATRTCDAEGVWGLPGACTGETERCGVDVMFLADVTGSHTGFFRSSETSITTDLVVPLEMDADVRVGISAFADFPVSPYGNPDPPTPDSPFIGVLEPTNDVGAVDTAISTIMFLEGGDGPEAQIEGLNDLSGGMPHPTAHPFTCAAGEVPGGCWRPTAAWRVIIVMTDTASHNLPDGLGGLVVPYTDLVPPAPDWTTVRANLVATGTYVYWIIPDTDGTVPGVTAVQQARELATELGEDPSEAIATYTAGSPDASFALRVVRAAMVAHFGIHVP